MMVLRIRSCAPDGGAFKYILNALGAAFQAGGVGFVPVMHKNVPNDFDLYLGSSGWIQNIPSKKMRGDKIVGIHVNPYGRRKVGAFSGGPVIDESPQAIKWTLAQQPDFVYCYCTEDLLDEYYGFWTTKHKLPIVPFPTAADTTLYRPHAPVQRYTCDIGWVGGYWPYKAVTLDQYLKPLFNRYDCKVYGWGNTWRNNQAIADNEVPLLFGSAKICPSVSEPHTIEHPIDVPERVFKIIASGGFTIHTPSPACASLFGGVVPMANNSKHWMELLDHYMKNDQERIELAKKQRELVIEKHTYFDRAIRMVETVAKINPRWNGVIANLKKAKSDSVGVSG